MTQTRSRWDILTGDTERDRRNVEILLESVEGLYRPRESHDAISHALERAIEVTGAQRGILLLANAAGDLVVHSACDSQGGSLTAPLAYSNSVVARVWDSNRAEIMVDAADQELASLGQSIRDLRLLSIMATPLSAKDERIGVLYVDSTVQAKEFTRGDFAVFSALGGMVAIAIENGRLLEERAARERMARELAVAREIQQGLFPTNIESPSGFDIAAEGRSCEETSGDYYDAIPLGDGRMALVVGDVSGHGLGAALFMTQTRALLHSFLRSDLDLPGVVSNLNAFLERDMPLNAFMTLFLCVLDPQARTLQYVNAGHNPPLHVRGLGQVDAWERTGPLLGVLDEAVFELSEPVPLESGDVVMLYTDGIFEAHSLANEMYGEDRFRDSLVAHTEAQPQARGILDGVLRDLASFCEGRALDDDVTSLVLRVQ